MNRTKVPLSVIHIDILRKAKRLKNGVATRAPSHGTSNLMSQASSQVHSDHVEPQPHVLELTPDALSPPLAPPQSSRSSKRRSSKPGRECARAWTVQAIGNNNFVLNCY